MAAAQTCGKAEYSLYFSGFLAPEGKRMQVPAGAAFRYKNARDHAVFKSETYDNSGVFTYFHRYKDAQAFLHISIVTRMPMWAWQREKRK